MADLVESTKKKRPAQPSTAEDARRKRAAANKVAALKLKIQNRTYRQIGKALGVAPKTAHSYVSAALGELHRMEVDLADDWRTLEVARLDSYARGLLEIATDKTNEVGERRRAFADLVRTSEVRSKLLGLVNGNPLGGTSALGASAPAPGSGEDEADPTLDHVSDAELRELLDVYTSRGFEPVSDRAMMAKNVTPEKPS